MRAEVSWVKRSACLSRLRTWVALGERLGELSSLGVGDAGLVGAVENVWGIGIPVGTFPEDAAGSCTGASSGARNGRTGSRPSPAAEEAAV